MTGLRHLDTMTHCPLWNTNTVLDQKQSSWQTGTLIWDANIVHGSLACCAPTQDPDTLFLARSHFRHLEIMRCIHTCAHLRFHAYFHYLILFSSCSLVSSFFYSDLLLLVCVDLLLLICLLKFKAILVGHFKL